MNKWTYVNSNNGLGRQNFTVTVTDPGNNQTVYTFSGELQTQVAYYQGAASGTPLKLVTTCYNTNFTNCPTWLPTDNGLPFQVTQTDVYTSFNGSESNLVETQFDSSGNTIEVKKYDFGAAMPPTGNPVSDTLIYYGQSWNGTACSAYPSGIYILNTACYAVTNDSAGSPVARTQITYSNTGHPTSTSRWVGGSNWLTSSATYGTNGAAAGVLSSITDVNGAATSYGNFVCNNMLPTTASYPLSLGTSQTWDSGCNGAVTDSTTDANQEPTNYTYTDPLWRMTSATDQNYPSVNLKYPDPTHFESYMNFNGSVSTVDTTTTTDGLGRPILVQKRNGQGTSNFDSVQYQYGWNSTGAFVKQSQPYSSSPTAWTTTQYDALGRTLSVTYADGGTVSYTYKKKDLLQAVSGSQSFQKQFEYDGLGRLTSVCEITSVSGSGACGQAISATGFLTKYTYDALGDLLTVTQNAQPGAIGGQQSRTYGPYDGLGRMTSETNPESGTTKYFWDAAPSACYPAGNGYATPGDLGAKLDQKGTYTCYGYDGLHRITGYGATGSGNCPNFMYGDQTYTPPSGVTITNGKGRLVRAYIASDCGGTISVDRWFSYTPRGEVSDIYESTPNSNGYYHISKQYWPNGVVSQLSGLPGVPTIYYGSSVGSANDGLGLDGEGRVTKVTDTSNNKLVTTASYNSASQVTGLTFGSGDSDAYTFDAAGRINGYTFTVNGQSVIGKPTWNTNGTLGSFQVTQDPFNSANVQTCNYGYDDLARVSSAICKNGSTNVWGQTLSYDPFGNITKTVPSGDTGISWMPNYASPPTNQYQSGWNGVSYDTDGHLTNDTFHTYQWDAYGHMAADDTSTFTYDAINHLAEASWGDQYLYDTNGRMLAGSHSQAAAYFADIPLPGGPIARYSNGTLSEYKHGDWLGSIRFSSTPGRTLNYDLAFAPFGEPYAPSRAGNIFAGMEQVIAADQYEATFREYNTTQGRWISPDPAGLAAANPMNPQTWNRYAYVLNNPLSLIDPTGLDCVYLNDSGTGVDNGGIDHNSNQGECWSNGGYWANGYIEGSSWVQTFSNSDNVIIDSSVNGFLGQTLAGSLNSGGTAFSQMFGLNASVDTILSNPFTPTNYVDPMAPSARQQLHAIANAAPTLCGGGAFGYYGKGVTAFGAKAFTGGIVEADSQSGISGGSLNEIGAGGVGGGSIVSSGGTSGLVYTELAEIPFLGSVGLVGFPTGVGVYAEGEAGNREFGGGLYANIVPNAGCHK